MEGESMAVVEGEGECVGVRMVVLVGK